MKKPEGVAHLLFGKETANEGESGEMVVVLFSTIRGTTKG